MVDKKNNLLIELEVRVKQVLQVCENLRSENADLKEEIQSKQSEILDREEKFRQIKAENDSLKMARTITLASINDDKSLDVARAKLSKMVREVDKCINLLK